MADLIPIDEIYNNIFFFVKFGERAHMESLKKGSLYMRNTRFYNELEEKQQNKGQGDKYDGKYVLKNVNVRMYNPITNDLIASSIRRPETAVTLQYTNSNKNPVFCLFAVYKENIIEEKKDDHFLMLKFAFTKEQKEHIKKYFCKADTALVILDVKGFMKKINTLVKKKILN